MNGYCGPYALGRVAGISTDEAARIIRGFSGARAVKGVAPCDLSKALRTTVPVITFLKRPHMTLAKWAAVRAKWDDKNAWVVYISGHYIVYRQGMVYDTFNPEGVAIDAYARKTAHMNGAWATTAWSPNNPRKVN